MGESQLSESGLYVVQRGFVRNSQGDGVGALGYAVRAFAGGVDDLCDHQSAREVAADNDVVKQRLTVNDSCFLQLSSQPFLSSTTSHPNGMVGPWD